MKGILIVLEDRDLHRLTIRTLTRIFYDIQKLRIQVGNRITQSFKARLEQLRDILELDEKETAKILKQVSDSHALMADGVARVSRRKRFAGDDIITCRAEFDMVSRYLDLRRNEEAAIKDIAAALKGIPIWDKFLKDVVGVGPCMAGVIIGEFRIDEARYASSLHKYAGLDVAEDGHARSKRAEHLIVVEYEDADGKTQTRRSITFNAFLHDKLLGVLATSFVMQGKRCPYEQVYRDYRHRIDNMKEHEDKSDGHRNNMARRYAVKRFIVDLYAAWRALEGLEVHPEYAVAKLNLPPHGGVKDVI